jgi:hypothetical protein
LSGGPQESLALTGNRGPLECFLRKLNRYQCFINADLEPFYRDSEIAISARAHRHAARTNTEGVSR